MKVDIQLSLGCVFLLVAAAVACLAYYMKIEEDKKRGKRPEERPMGTPSTLEQIFLTNSSLEYFCNGAKSDK